MKNQDLPQTLHEKLTFAKASTTMEHLLHAQKMLVFNDFVQNKETNLEPSVVWRKINLLEAKPSSRIGTTVSLLFVHQWLQELLDVSFIEGSCYLSIGGSVLPWAMVEIRDQGDWLRVLWSDPLARELVILSSSQEQVLALTEEEHYYHAFVYSVVGGELQQVFL